MADKNHSRYPHTYAVDFLRLSIEDSVSRSNMSQLIGIIAETAGIDPNDLKQKLADRYIVEEDLLAQRAVQRIHQKESR